MNVTFLDRLVAAPDGERAALIAQLPEGIGESEVDMLAERSLTLSASMPAESLRIAKTAIELAEALGAPRGRALAFRALAVVLRASGQWQDALECFDQGVRCAEEAGDALLAAQIPIAQTDALAQLSRFDDALRLADSIYTRLRNLGAEEDAAKVLSNTGNIHFRREAYSNALDCWLQALAFFESRGDTLRMANHRMKIANVYTHLNRLPEAFQMYAQARKHLETLGQEQTVAGIDGNLGFYQYVSGQLTESLQSYSRARRRFDALNLVKDVTQCDREAADVYLELNLIPEARETFERVIPLLQEMNMMGEAARSELGLAVALSAQDRVPEAALALHRAEVAFQNEGNEIGIARVKLQRVELQRRSAEQMRNAQELYTGMEREARAARKLFQKHGVDLGVVQSRLQLAETRVAMGEYPVRSLRALLGKAQQGSYITLIWRIELALARAHRSREKRRGALIHYRRAVDAVERTRMLLQGDEFRVAFLQDKMRLYEELLALLLDHGTPQALRESFQLTERAKSRSLLEMLDNTLANRPPLTSDGEALAARLEELRSQLNWDYARIHQIADAAVRLPVADAALSDRLPILERDYLHTHRQLQLNRTPDIQASDHGMARIEDLQALLTEDEQIVEFVTVKNEVLAFVIGRNSFRPVRCLASRVEVEEQIDRLRFQWSKFGPVGYEERYREQLTASAHQVLQQLYELLLEPLAPLLTSNKLSIIPHGVLHGIPFHALYNGETYALDRWEIAYAPSASVWKACRYRNEPVSDRSLIIGLSDPGIAHVQDEVAALGKLLPNATVFQDEKATLSCVPLDGDFRYIHFATHAVFRKDNPLFSGLRLSDGWLIAHDLYHRRLECSLATLSACRTGLSSVVPGDELLGLVRGFLCAGARAVMVSLWSAHDVATDELMRLCYEKLAEGFSRATALRYAQQTLRTRYPHPYYWAAFSLVGAR